MLIQCWSNVVDGGPTLDQQRPTYCDGWVTVTANNKLSGDAGLMLVQRRRRWASINPTLALHLLLARYTCFKAVSST